MGKRPSPTAENQESGKGCALSERKGRTGQKDREWERRTSCMGRKGMEKRGREEEEEKGREEPG